MNTVARDDATLLAELRAVGLGLKDAQHAVKSIRSWVKCSQSTTIDRVAAVQGLRLMFEGAGLTLKDVMWCSSPLEGLAYASTCGEAVTETVIYNPLVTVKNRVAEDLGSDYTKLLQVFLANVPASTDSGMRAVAKAVAVELVERSRVLQNTQFETLVKQAAPLSLDAAHIATYSFLVKLGTTTCEPVRGAATVLAAGVDWCWIFGDVAVVAPRPTKIEFESGLPHNAKGPAIKYADGFDVCCWHGVWMPAGAAKLGWQQVQALKDGSADLQNAIVEAKAKEWSESKPKALPAAPGGPAPKAPDDESEDERFEAALAVKRLGGVSSVKELIENVDETPPPKS